MEFGEVRNSVLQYLLELWPNHIRMVGRIRTQLKPRITLKESEWRDRHIIGTLPRIACDGECRHFLGLRIHLFQLLTGYPSLNTVSSR